MREFNIFKYKKIRGIEFTISITNDKGPDHFIKGIKIKVETPHSSNTIRISRTDNPNR